MAMPNQYSQGTYSNYQPGGPQYDQQPLMQGQGAYGPVGNYPPGNYPPSSFPPQGGGMGMGMGMGMGGYPGGQFPGNASTTLKQMSTVTNMNLVCFAAACTIMVASCIAGFAFFFDGFQLEDWLLTVFLFCSGAILAVLDTPFFKTIKFVGDTKLYIWKFLRLATRVTGKGIMFLFCGVTLFVLLYDNFGGGAFAAFLSVTTCLFVVGVAFTVLVIGLLKSHRLGKARQKLIETGAIEHRYDQWAQTYRGPQGGLTPSEFNSLTMENGGYKFEDHDLKAIFNALVSREPWRTPQTTNNAGGRPMVDTEPKIPKEDLVNWVKGGWVWL